jgi:hypothetical protein
MLPLSFESPAYALPSYVGLHEQKEPAVERVLRFVVTLATLPGAGEAAGYEFVEELLWRCSALSGAASPAVRFRACQLVSLTLTSLSLEAELTDELYVSLTEAMLKRLRDKTPAARVEAARALARLQARGHAAPGALAALNRPRVVARRRGGLLCRPSDKWAAHPAPLR